MENKENTKAQIIVVCGPTASGKTFVSIELAKILGGEIISADSMQIYKELNIGTAKPTREEMSGIPHHLIDIVSINDDTFSVAEYVKRAGECAEDILRRGKVPVICGGTGLYIDHFIKNTQFTEYENDIEYRNELEKLPNEELYAKLVKIDPKSADIIHVNNKKRIIRALEIFKITGKNKSEIDAMSQCENSRYDFIKLGLRYADRNLLYDRINNRVDGMLKNGLLDEVKKLYREGEEDNIKRIGAIGYVEIIDYFNDICGFDEAVEKIKQHTRNYAKRQITWFKRDLNTVWIDIDEENIANSEEIIKNCLNYVHLN
ncbi:MAG: tRNA (adenosine(37)-N6)-dimethylallyltransferase MiaA [Oscillospiraceae bacterium]|nr:tRNA (adenosine(37)-N6)-dimethylallyltransferase MiaA [Oscillospiraceae bacterium]